MFLYSVHWEVFVIVCHEESALVCDMCLHVLEITIHKCQIAAGHQILPSSRGWAFKICWPCYHAALYNDSFPKTSIKIGFCPRACAWQSCHIKNAIRARYCVNISPNWCKSMTMAHSVWSAIIEVIKKKDLFLQVLDQLIIDLQNQ